MAGDGEFYERAIHTDVAEVPRLRDHTAGQFLLKMAALHSGGLGQGGTPLTVRFTRDLGLEVVTPIGVYAFLLDADGENLVVEQVL